MPITFTYRSTAPVNFSRLALHYLTPTLNFNQALKSISSRICGRENVIASIKADGLYTRDFNSSNPGAIKKRIRRTGDCYRGRR